MSDTIRLNKHLAHYYGYSRRQADQLIENGRVTVNGETASLGSRITQGDAIAIDKKPLKPNNAITTIAFHKPRGYVCSRKQQGDTPTLYALLPHHLHNLKPVGRLDADSSGIILLTNDGDLAHTMTHPKFQKTKQYNVTLDKALEPLHQQMIADFGIMLPDGKSTLGLTRTSDASRSQWIVTMTEGRNRQIRRTFGALGYTVTALHRTHFGPYQLNDLASGAFEVISKDTTQ